MYVRMSRLLAERNKFEWTNLNEKSSVRAWRITLGDVIERTCPTCGPDHKIIVYKRLTDPGTIDFKNLFLHQVDGETSRLNLVVVQFQYNMR